MEFQIENALGKYVIVEPYEKSTVLQAEEISTVFRVVSIGTEWDVAWNWNGDSWYVKEGKTYRLHFTNGDLVIVAPNSIEKTLMGQKEIYFARISDIIAKVKDGQSPTV